MKKNVFWAYFLLIQCTISNERYTSNKFYCCNKLPVIENGFLIVLIRTALWSTSFGVGRIQDGKPKTVGIRNLNWDSSILIEHIHPQLPTKNTISGEKQYVYSRLQRSLGNHSVGKSLSTVLRKEDRTAYYADETRKYRTH